MIETDVVIVGAGPVGIFCGFQAGMLGIKTKTIDVLDIPGGQCTSLYPEKPIYDIPGFKSIKAGNLIDNLLQQLEPFDNEFLLNQQVTNINKMNDGFVVGTTKNNQILCKAIVIAAGTGAFVHKKPALENIEEYEGKSVLYTVQNPEIFRNKKVAIAGGGDSAADWAILLSDIASQIYLIHRRDNLRCLPDSVAKIENLCKLGKIKKMIPYQLSKINGSAGNIDNLLLYDMDNKEASIDVDFLLPFFGLSNDLGPVLNWGLNFDKKYISVNQSTMQTSVEGIYAIGDVATYSNKLKLILVGFAEAATAMHQVYNIIFPDKPLHFEHSTSNPKFLV